MPGKAPRLRRRLQQGATVPTGWPTIPAPTRAMNHPSVYPIDSTTARGAAPQHTTSMTAAVGPAIRRPMAVTTPAASKNPICPATKTAGRADRPVVSMTARPSAGRPGRKARSDDHGSVCPKTVCGQWYPPTAMIEYHFPSHRVRREMTSPSGARAATRTRRWVTHTRRPTPIVINHRHRSTSSGTAGVRPVLTGSQ